ncbi:hypothetical protein [Clostridium tertium]|uniref:hypothetical protein n=1 Tax=Clostridium tertium TaxID=1559 RepID=UPI0035686CFC
MSEIKEFIRGLEVLEFNRIAIEVDNIINLVNLKNAVLEIDKIGVKEIGSIYFEEMDFISNSDDYVLPEFIIFFFYYFNVTEELKCYDEISYTYEELEKEYEEYYKTI